MDRANRTQNGREMFLLSNGTQAKNGQFKGDNEQNYKDDDEEIGQREEFLVKEEEQEEEESREQWSNYCEYILSLIGYAVGVSNLWRFPYLCLKNGGGAFLIPFFLFLVIAGIPLYYMEVALGQFSGTSCLYVWKLCPLFRGLGYCMIIVSGMTSIYYNTVLSWFLYYLYSSFTAHLPWASCGHSWNTKYCVDSRHSSHQNQSGLNHTEATLYGNETGEGEGMGLFSWKSNLTSNVNGSDTMENMTERIAKSAAEEFWHNHVLSKSGGLHELGAIQGHSAVVLLLAWLLIFLCLIRGVKSLGKVVYVTVLLPYLLLTILLCRGAMLPGAADGILFYVKPDFSRLASASVWIEACLQVFFSLGPGWGTLITMASFSKFHNGCLKVAVIGSLADGLTSFYGGFVIFSVLGFMAKEANTTVDQIAAQGPGLALVAYPEAISKLPLPPLWAVLFFIMLLALGLDTQFGMVETVVSGLVDTFPRFLTKWRGVVTLCFCVLSYLLALPVTTRGGIYVFQLLDWYVTAFCLVLTSFIECIVVGWIYGVERFSTDIELMTGSRPSLLIKLCWCFVGPAVMLTAFIFIAATYTLPTYDGYVYPREANILGFFISVIPLLPVPFFMIKELMSREGTLKQRLIKSLTPDPSWGPSKKEYRPLYRQRLPGVRTAFTDVFRRKSDTKMQTSRI